MKLYLLDIGEQCMGTSPISPDSSHKSEKRNGERNLKVVVPFQNEDPDVLDARNLPDVINVGLELLVSHKVYATLLSLRLCPSICVSPVDIVNRSGNRLAKYRLLWSDTWHSIIDRSRSHFDVYEDSDVISTVYKWAIERSNVPPYDLFLCELAKWVASEQAVDELLAINTIGIQFLEIA
jgi:hypothetical protein